ncbi:MAG: ribonuclease III [Prevotellaceae bacterium]|jgi:ribonuclease-3|nr:ribonuclease III [Prevotellaceae bacterium]
MSFFSGIRRKLVFLLSKDREFRKKLKQLLGTLPGNVEYYKCAFTHRSAVGGSKKNGHNERLEYLGDAMLGAIVADYLYEKYPSHEEGLLTKMRSKLVNRVTLLNVGKTMNLDKFIITQVNIGIEGKFLLSNMVEALVGAVYLDLGYKSAKYFVVNILLKDLLNSDIERLEYDFKSKILEWGQKRKQEISFVSQQTTDKEYPPVFFSDILIDGIIAGSGTGYTKKESEQNAAKEVWRKWENPDNKLYVS